MNRRVMVLHACVVSAALVVVVPGAQAGDCPPDVDVCVRVEPPDLVVDINSTSTFTLDLVADINTPVVGWGLDLNIETPGVVSVTGTPDIPFPPWIDVFAPDGDGLAAVADPFPPTNGSVSGLNILLATLTFSVDRLGETDLVPSVTEGDLTEGFPLDPMGFGTVTFQNGHVMVIPEPTTAILLALAFAVAKPRRRSHRRR